MYFICDLCGCRRRWQSLGKYLSGRRKACKWCWKEVEINRPVSRQRKHQIRTGYKSPSMVGCDIVIEIVHLHVVAARDKYICHLCGKRINRKGDRSLDHLVPVSLGGEHSYTNVKLAHRRCNSRKGNRFVSI